MRDTQIECEHLVSEMAAHVHAPKPITGPDALHLALAKIKAQNVGIATSSSLRADSSKGITPAALRQGGPSGGITIAGPKLFPVGAPPPYGGDDGYDFEYDDDGHGGEEIPKKTTKKKNHPGGGDPDPDDDGDDGDNWEEEEEEADDSTDHGRELLRPEKPKSLKSSQRQLVKEATKIEIPNFPTIAQLAAWRA